MMSSTSASLVAGENTLFAERYRQIVSEFPAIMDELGAYDEASESTASDFEAGCAHLSAKGVTVVQLTRLRKLFPRQTSGFSRYVPLVMGYWRSYQHRDTVVRWITWLFILSTTIGMFLMCGTQEHHFIVAAAGLTASTSLAPLFLAERNQLLARIVLLLIFISIGLFGGGFSCGYAYNRSSGSLMNVFLSAGVIGLSQLFGELLLCPDRFVTAAAPLRRSLKKLLNLVRMPCCYDAYRSLCGGDMGDSEDDHELSSVQSHTVDQHQKTSEELSRLTTSRD